MRNSKGFTLIEMVIGMALTVILIGSTVYVYNKQDKVLRNENSNSQLRNFARMAMDELVGNIRLAGYGFPPGDSGSGRPARGLTYADATRITFRANTDNIFTQANADSVSTDVLVYVGDTTGFTGGLNQNVVFFNLNNPSQWNTYSLYNVVTNTELNWGLGNTNGFNILPVTNGIPVVVNRFHLITYDYDVANKRITLADDNGTDDGGADDTTITVVDKVFDLTISYFDAGGNLLTPLPLSSGNLGEVRNLQISLTLVDSLESNITATLQTNLYLRNMGK